jgi:hypothetical protein
MSESSFQNLRRPLTERRGLTAWLGAAALGYALAGALATLAWSPRVPYADQWRHYARLLAQSFPASVFAADNGHAEVLPNLVRLADLRAFGGHETLQLGGGLLLALVAVALLARAIWRDRSLAPAQRAAGLFAIVFGVFWLGNLRALTETGDSVHVYLVLTCLAGALALLLGESIAAPSRWRNALAASALCSVASFSFGSGIATFAAVLALMLLRREPPVRIAVPVLAGLATSILYLALAGTQAPSAAPVDVLITSLRLLGAPFMYLFWPLLDPAAAAAAPAPLRALLMPIAQAWTAHGGDIRVAVWPQATMGALGCVLAVLIGARAGRAELRPAAALGLALVVFGSAVALLIALARQDYFLVNPAQISAPRYVPWSSLFWSGLLLACVAQARRPRIAITIAAVLPLIALASEIGLGVLARHVREVAENTALYVAVGVLPDATPLGETDLDDLRRALPLLRDAHTAMFAWPDAILVDRAVSPAAGAPPPLAADATDIEVTPVANALGDPGRRISARIVLPCNSDRVLVIEHDHVVGLLRRSLDGTWRGVARGEDQASAPTFAADCGRH